MPPVKHNKKSSKRPSKTQREYETDEDEEYEKDVEGADTEETETKETEGESGDIRATRKWWRRRDACIN